MTLGLDKISYTIRSGKIYLKLLDATSETIEKINKLGDYLDSLVGEKVSKIKTSKVESIVEEDWKVSRGLLKILLSYFYQKRTLSFSEILTESEIEHLNKLRIKTPEDFRFYFFKWVQTEYRGFIPLEERDITFQTACKHFGINSPEKIIILLFADREKNQLLEKKFEIDPTRVVALYNFEALSTLTYYAKKVTIRAFLENMGMLARHIYSAAKRRGILCDFEKDVDSLLISIYGPKQFYGRATKYGLGIIYVIYSFFKYVEQLKIKTWSVDILLQFRNKDLTLTISSKSGVPFLTTPYEPEWETFFDSNAEKRFYSLIKYSKLEGWDIIREPEPIILKDNKIMIPDFMLVKGDKRILVELIGYWRDEYIKKKLEKLEALRDKDIKMLLLVNYKHKGLFEKFKFPIVFYKQLKNNRIEIPFATLKQILSQF